MDSDGARSASPSKALSNALPGTVSEALPSAMYRVRLDDGPYVLTHIADRIERNFVRVLVGDRVRVELVPEGGRGRIVEKLA